ncbi:hypothetical protein JAAARDRAFT_28036 [Jaapia argillacea MUCL 33604]|uniref:N-acetyltransferase domain-containing protein n=1 Tax=Jaapia argillacea MUCL 33604 TaxID=933084 RepID=A0A067QE35_9AGAM|nr:hypothetical protein JAAARDRAFT_28036 [Jaapia argillacea MUCL 33604]
MSVPAHEIIIVPENGQDGRIQLRQLCYDVRIDVFISEQGFPLEAEIDDLDETATHFLLRLVPSLTPIGTIRGYKGKNAPYYKLNRLAVLKDYRNFRFGRALVLALHDWVRADALKRGERDFVEIVCHSQIPVKGFYVRLGYEAQGEEFDEDGAPHQKMVAQLPLLQ